MSNYGMFFDAPKVTEESVESLKEAILSILDTNNDQKTKRLALEVLSKGVSVNYNPNMSISGCSVVMEKEKSEISIEDEFEENK